MNERELPAFEWVMVTRDPMGGVELSSSRGLSPIGGAVLLLEGRDQLVTHLGRTVNGQSSSAPVATSPSSPPPTEAGPPPLTQADFDALLAGLALPQMRPVLDNLIAQGRAMRGG